MYINQLIDIIYQMIRTHDNNHACRIEPQFETSVTEILKKMENFETVTNQYKKTSSLYIDK